MTTNKVINLAFNPSGTTSPMAILNSGMVLFRSGRATYNLLTGSFGALGDLGGVGIDTSPDGSRATGGSADNTGSIPIKYYDASTDTITISSSFFYYQRGMMDTHANRTFVSNNLFDKNMIYLGPLSVASIFGAITADGTKVYGHFGANNINVVDITGLPPYNVIGTLAVDEIGSVVISSDGNTLFSVGHNNFTVRNTGTVVPVP